VLYAQLRRTVTSWRHLSLVSGVVCCSREMVEVFMTISLTFMRKATEQHKLMYAVINPDATVGPARPKRGTTVEANYRQEASRGLSATAELLVWNSNKNFAVRIEVGLFTTIVNNRCRASHCVCNSWPHWRQDNVRAWFTTAIVWRQVERKAVIIFAHILYLKPGYLSRGSSDCSNNLSDANFLSVS